MKRNLGDVLENISYFLTVTALVACFGVYAYTKYQRKYEVLQYIDLKHRYKNCIIIGKSDHKGYMLLLHNPVLHKNDTTGVLNVDYKVYTKDYVYFNNYIGDIIK